MFSKFFHFQAIIRGHTFAPSGKLIITRNDETVSPCPGWFAISTLPPILLFPKCYLLLQLLCVMSYYVIRNETVRLLSYLPNPLHISCGATFPVARLHSLGYFVSFSRVVSRVTAIFRVRVLILPLRYSFLKITGVESVLSRIFRKHG